MNLTRRALLASATLAPAVRAQTHPPRKRRADSFFGIHFDLHPQATDTELGKDLSRENIEAFLDAVRPDYVQYDCKGHAGWLGYPSKVSPSAPLVQDSLALWRAVTRERGVALYIHFSGVWDSLAVSEKPEWARLNAEGARDDRQTSLWSAYATDRMIPQLLEVSAQYDLDGAWVDGECWQTNPDYSPAALTAWRGLGAGLEAPKSPTDPNWHLWLEFQRQRFRDYVRTYVDRLHQARPGFQIASNWLYTTYVPEKPELPVDFLSGDYLGNAALTRARLDARYLARTGKPWDLMAWGFQIASTEPAGHIHKPAVQLEQEAAVVLAQGGGFQIYYQPTRAGRIDPRQIRTMARVAAFCRERQSLAHKSHSLSDTAVLFSRRSLYRTSNKLFGGWGKHISHCAGLLDALLEGHRSVDVLPDWSPLNYPVLVIPEWTDLGDALVGDIAQRVRSGLRLLLTGAGNAARFAPEFGWRLRGEASRQPAWVAGDDIFGIASGLWQDVDPASAQLLAERYSTYDSQRPAGPAALLWKIGAGQVLLCPGPLGEVFDQTHGPALRQFLRRAIDTLSPAQCWLKDSTAPVEVVLRRQGDADVAHLLNHANKQVAGNFPAVDHVPTLPGQTLYWRRPTAPRRVFWEPAGLALGFRHSEGILEVDTPPLAVHGMVVLR
jgi:hypothetical protein